MYWTIFHLYVAIYIYCITRAYNACRDVQMYRDVTLYPWKWESVLEEEITAQETHTQRHTDRSVGTG